MKTRPQRTLKKESAFTGVGIHTGKEVSIRFCPAPPHSGIVFQRIDLPSRPTIPAAIEYVQDTSRSTTIGIGTCVVQTVEHVLAALNAYQIDNLCVQVTDSEPPVGDGSSNIFVKLIEEAGIENQKESKSFLPLTEPVYLRMEPPISSLFRQKSIGLATRFITPIHLRFAHSIFPSPINQENFKNEIASCRTFALYEEITTLMQKGLIRGGSLENAVVIKDDVVFSKEGLRFSDEMVRHKILDLIGDLSLVGFPFLAHIIAIRSGHWANVQLGKALVKSLTLSNRREN